jgi:hypothetical protein
MLFIIFTPHPHYVYMNFLEFLSSNATQKNLKKAERIPRTQAKAFLSKNYSKTYNL